MILCVYCGRPALRGRAVAVCARHRDLPALDPEFTPPPNAAPAAVTYTPIFSTANTHRKDPQ